MLPPPVPTSSFSRHRPVRSKAASGGHRRGAAHGLFEKQGASREFASSAWKPRWCAELPQSPQQKPDCAQAYANLVAAVNAAPSIAPALKQSGSLNKFRKDFWTGFAHSAPPGANNIAWFGRALLIAADIPGNWLMTSSVGAGEFVAGLTNAVFDPSDPVGDAMQAHNAAVDKAIADYKAAVKNCK